MHHVWGPWWKGNLRIPVAWDNGLELFIERNPPTAKELIHMADSQWTIPRFFAYRYIVAYVLLLPQSPAPSSWPWLRSGP